MSLILIDSLTPHYLESEQCEKLNCRLNPFSNSKWQAAKASFLVTSHQENKTQCLKLLQQKILSLLRGIFKNLTLPDNLESHIK